MASPESIRVRAVEGIFAPVPGYAATHGGQVEYVGRRVDHEAIVKSTKVRIDGVKVFGDPGICYPADGETNTVFSRELGISVLGTLRRMILDGDVTAGDEVTAKWAGVKLDKPAEKPAAPSPEPTARVPRRTITTDTTSETK